MECVVFDIGGTKTRIASMASNHKVAVVEKFDTGSAQAFVEKLRKFCVENNLSNPVVAGSVAGEVQSNKLVFAPNLDHSWDNFDFADQLSDFCQLVAVNNDVELGGLAESVLGAGRQLDRFGYVSIGTGFGGALINHRQIAVNEFGFEPGHAMSVAGNITIEELFGGRSVEARFSKKPYEINDDTFWLESSRNLAHEVLQIAIMWSTTDFIFGGSMILGDPGYRLSIVQSELTKLVATKEFIADITLHRAQLGDYSNLIGASLLIT